MRLTPQVEPGQSVDQLVLSVTNISAADESLGIGGTSVSLTNHSETVGALNVTVLLSGTTATVTITNAGLTEGAVATLIDGLSYTKAGAVSPGEPPRVITIVSLHDDGGNADPGDDPKQTPRCHAVKILSAIVCLKSGHVASRSGAHALTKRCPPSTVSPAQPEMVNDLPSLTLRAA